MTESNYTAEIYDILLSIPGVLDGPSDAADISAAVAEIEALGT